ncbi:MAG: archease [Candidatus Zixiibacteriota bacterium]
MKSYEFIEHTADIIIRAYGDNLEEAFASAATALFDLLTGGTQRECKQKVELEVEAVDIEGLLVNFLSELIVMHEVENMVFKDFEVTLLDTTSLKAVAWGEKFSQSKHGGGISVKAATYHMIEIVDNKGQEPSFVQILFDV